MTEQSRAGCRFFQRLTDSLRADRIHQTQDDPFVSKQLQSPVTRSRRGSVQANWTSFCSTFPLILILFGRAGCGR